MSDSAVLQSVLASSGRELSPESAAWLGSCLNPFSDYQQSLVGYPDVNTQASVIRMYSSQNTISAPVGVVGNWDCVVYSTPIDSTDRAQFAAETAGLVSFDSASLAGVDCWGLTTLSGATGSDCSLMSPTATRSGLNSRNVAGLFGRVIAKGFEVSNSTAEIYRQGTVVSAIVPSSPKFDRTIVFADSAGTITRPTLVHASQMGRMPATLQELRAIPQSVQWEASKGVYFVPRLTSEPDLQTETGAGLCYSTTTSGYGPSIVLVGSGIAWPSVAGHDSFCNGVTWFSGLSPQTTLTISYRTIVEYFPTPDSNLISEASPSAAYDPGVLTVYNQAAKVAPFAVPVDQNAAGDFFRKVLGAVKKVAPIASKLLTPFPIASRVVNSVGNMAGVLSASPVARAPMIMNTMPSEPMFTQGRVVRKRKPKRRKARRVPAQRYYIR